jgi:hypothetical protein
MKKNNIIFLLFTALVTFGCATKKQSPPNILFCISDDQSFPHAGAYGCDWVKMDDNMKKNVRNKMRIEVWSCYRNTDIYLKFLPITLSN